jgi:hypothetical protein
MRNVLLIIIITFLTIGSNDDTNRYDIVFLNSNLTINGVRIDIKTPLDTLIKCFGKPDKQYEKILSIIRAIDPGHDTARIIQKFYEYKSKGIIIEYDSGLKSKINTTASNTITFKYHKKNKGIFINKITIDRTTINSDFNRNMAIKLFNKWSFSSDSLMCYKSDNKNYPFCNYCSIKFNKKNFTIEELSFVLGPHSP